MLRGPTLRRALQCEARTDWREKGTVVPVEAFVTECYRRHRENFIDQVRFPG